MWTCGSNRLSIPLGKSTHFWLFLEAPGLHPSPCLYRTVVKGAGRTCPLSCKFHPSGWSNTDPRSWWRAKPSQLLLQGGWTSKDVNFHSALPLSLRNPHTDDHPSITDHQTDGGPFLQDRKTTWHFFANSQSQRGHGICLPLMLGCQPSPHRLNACTISSP